MKRLLVLSLVCLGFLNVAVAAESPQEGPKQKVYVLHKGAALLAHVESSSVSRDVVGYKAAGFLAQRQPEEIEAVITARCPTSDLARTTTIRLGREWHGTGYMSAPLDFRSLFPSGSGREGCPVRGDTPLQIAFSDGSGRWDPANYNDIVFSQYEFYSSRSLFETPEQEGEIALGVWDFLVDQMRR